MADPPIDAPEVPILFLGDSEVGISTFLSRLSLGTQTTPSHNSSIPLLRDLDQPFPFDIRLFNRPYTFHFYDTNSPANWTLLQPAVIVLCYSIAEPASLASLTSKWRKVIAQTWYAQDEKVPLIVVGLQRDVRSKEDYGGSVKPFEVGSGSGVDGNDGAGLLEQKRAFVYPQEGLQVAQELRADRYCECSALTGELCFEVFEDIARTGAMTTTARGGKSEGTACTIM